MAGNRFPFKQGVEISQDVQHSANAHWSNEDTYYPAQETGIVRLANLNACKSQAAKPSSSTLSPEPKSDTETSSNSDQRKPTKLPRWKKILFLEKDPIEENTPPSPVKKKRSLLIRVLLWKKRGGKRWRRYGMLGILILSAIWGLTISYLKFTPPTYTSEWTILLPGAGLSAVVNLDAVGQVSSSAASPYSQSSLSPKVTYQNIAQHDTVLKEAAAQVGMSLDELGKPKIKLIQETTLMLFSITGGSPRQAYLKAWALYGALQDQLRTLRDDEVRQREADYEVMLRNVTTRILETRKALLAYQTETGLVSPEQYTQLVLTVENLRKQLSDVKAQHELRVTQVKQLTDTLSITPEFAAEALMLVTDKQFQEYLKNYADAASLLTVYSSKWGNNHPNVIKEAARKHASMEAMKIRSQELVGHRDFSLLSKLNVSGSASRAQLFTDLIKIDAERAGLAGQIEELGKLIKEYSERLKSRSTEAARLEELLRENELAEAVFTSAQARIETSQSDRYASYPLLQMLSTPSLPEKPSSPKKNLTLIGAALASFFTITGLLLLWIRLPYLQKILKSE